MVVVLCYVFFFWGGEGGPSTRDYKAEGCARLPLELHVPIDEEDFGERSQMIWVFLEVSDMKSLRSIHPLSI